MGLATVTYLTCYVDGHDWQYTYVDEGTEIEEVWRWCMNCPAAEEVEEN